MTKRTYKEIEHDYKRIRQVVDTTFVTSIKEIAKKLDLTESAVKTSLSKHPRVEKNIMAQLEKNKQEAVAKKEEQKIQDSLKKVDTPDTSTSDDYIHGYVLDASITGYEALLDYLSKISSTTSKIILTTITIKELHRLEKANNNLDSYHSRQIFRAAIENENKFLTVSIDELNSPDDSILAYCNSNKHRVTLLTSDKEMFLLAKANHIKTVYLKKHVATPKQLPHNKIITLLDARTINGKLSIRLCNTVSKKITVISNTIEYAGTNDFHELKEGDNVFIATNKPDYVTFAHYIILNTSTIYNAEIIYHLRLNNVAEAKLLPKANYKTFVRDFYKIQK